MYLVLNRKKFSSLPRSPYRLLREQEVGEATQGKQ